MAKRNFWKDGLYWAFRFYLQFFHDKVYYRRIYRVGAENIPPVGTPLLVACNHQNSINDPLALELKMGLRVISIFARADVFSRPLIAAFLRSLYILPSYRLKQDGEDSLSKNFDAFKEANERLLNGNTVAIFPEATNQTCHWLGEFSLGYLRMAFGAAEASGFEREIFILPVANHYSNYFCMQSDMVLIFGQPISLKPYYELYQTKPRTAQRQVNVLVRRQIADMMLNIEDLEHYDAIDYLRNTYGTRYAERVGLRANYLPERLTADKQLCARLEQEATAEPERMNALYADVMRLKEQTRALNIRDWNMQKDFNAARLLLQGLLFVLLLPLFVLSMIPNLLVFIAPRGLVKKFREMGGTFVMFQGGIQYIVSSLISAPINYGAVFVAELLLVNWWVALIHLLLQPWLLVFAWHYMRFFVKWRSEWRWHRLQKTEEGRRLTDMRASIWQRVDDIVNRA
ncbi:MAG: 1-acyl-sn-glycerol-3-phosphate acyltransferase [Paludibacteraceae bacterium]|nr:1-acyl-sn-glycerol-3-phosphate acyltransferase [Paludibacteraceae bacterium]